MRTNRYPHDYVRRQKLPSAEIRAREQAIMAWIDSLVRWYGRGLLTKTEFDRLADKGPSK